MKPIFIGTKLAEGEHHVFGIRAAESGLSKSALLKKLVLDFVGPIPPAKPPTRRKASKKEVASV